MAELLGSPNGPDRDSAAAPGPGVDQTLACPIRDEISGSASSEDSFLAADESAFDLPPAPRPAPTVVAELAAQLDVTTPAAPETLVQPPSLPGYEILHEIGRGGMGVVYKARHLKLKRIVALKVVLAGGHAAPRDLARFATEAEAAARLQHPHIVQVHDVVEHEGLPYLVQEFVEGGSLRQKLHKTPIPALEAAKLVKPLAQAIHYAHEHGIVHRDLKPANVLLTSDGTPKIADFGLAKLFEGQAVETASGAGMGTPNYMAPEQAAGEKHPIGPSVDVYALGAILYEALTGRPPFRGATVLETLEQVRTQEPVSLRRLQPGLPRDLETICLKCLEKEPRKRYASAQALAEDLQRFLSGEAIQARPAGLWERGLKWTKRRPAVAALVAVIVTATLGLLGLGAWHILQLESLNAQLKTERDSARWLRDLAQEQEREARRQKEEIEKAYRREAERGRAYRDLAQLTGATTSKSEAITLYENAKASFEELIGKFPTEIAYQRDLGLCHYQMGALYTDINRTQAIKYLDEAVKIQEPLARDYPDAKHFFDLAVTLALLAGNYRDTAKFKESDLLYQRTVELLRALVRDHPTATGYERLLGRAYQGQGFLYRRMNRQPESEAAYQLALKIAEKMYQARPSSLVYQRDLAIAYEGLGDFYRQSRPRRLDEAEASYDRALQLTEQLARAQPMLTRSAVDLGVALVSRGHLARNRGQLPTALDWYERAIERLEFVQSKEPLENRALRYLADAYMFRAEILMAVDRLAEARETWEKAASLDKLRVVQETFRVRAGHAETLARLGDYARAATKANGLAKRSPLLDNQRFTLARIYALCYAAAARDAELAQVVRDTRVVIYAHSALGQLTKAHAAGHFNDPANREKLEKENAFQPLRDRPEFRKLSEPSSVPPPSR